MNTLPDENGKRFVAVLNKKIEIGKLLNALGHMTAGLAGSTAEDMCFIDYTDRDGGTHASISHYPFIVLKADNSNQIRSLRNECRARGIAFTDFTDTMTIGTSLEQQQKTLATPEIELEYFGICLFGSTNDIHECTKKFSLFR